MSNENEMFNKEFYQNMERSIENLPQSLREKLYRPCAKCCVEKYVLAEQQRQFDECGKDLDAQYEKYGKSPYFFADIIEKGHIYEIGYPTAECVCPVVSSGMSASKVHCECSRQSMRYVLETLLPNKDIKIEMLHSVLTGDKECRFKVIVE